MSEFRVLVVDDDFMVARLHASVVAAAGMVVAGVAHTGEAALRLIEQEQPDLLLLDVYLPDMTGLELVHQLRARSTAGPDVIILSAARDLDSIRRAQHGGVFQYLVKPFEVETLQERLRDYATYRAALDGVVDARQEEVDLVFQPMHARARRDAPKGLSNETTDLVVAALRAAPAGKLSAQECADATGMSRSSARRYLEHLVDTGRVQVRNQYGTTGRPERRYREL